MTKSIETIEKYPKIQEVIELIVDKYSNESYKTESQIGQNAVI